MEIRTISIQGPITARFGKESTKVRGVYISDTPLALKVSISMIWLRIKERKRSLPY